MEASRKSRRTGSVVATVSSESADPDLERETRKRARPDPPAMRKETLLHTPQLIAGPKLDSFSLPEDRKPCTWLGSQNRQYGDGPHPSHDPQQSTSASSACWDKLCSQPAASSPSAESGLGWSSPEQVRFAQQREDSFLATPVDVSSAFTPSSSQTGAVCFPHSPVLALDPVTRPSCKPRIDFDVCEEDVLGCSSIEAAAERKLYTCARGLNERKGIEKGGDAPSGTQQLLIEDDFGSLEMPDGLMETAAFRPATSPGVSGPNGVSGGEDADSRKEGIRVGDRDTGKCKSLPQRSVIDVRGPECMQADDMLDQNVASKVTFGVGDSSNHTNTGAIQVLSDESMQQEMCERLVTDSRKEYDKNRTTELTFASLEMPHDSQSVEPCTISHYCTVNAFSENMSSPCNITGYQEDNSCLSVGEKMACVDGDRTSRAGSRSAESARPAMVSYPHDIRLISRSKQQGAKIKKQRRRSAFGAEFHLTLEAVTETSETATDADLVTETSETATNADLVQDLNTGRIIYDKDRDVQTGVRTSVSELPELEGLDEKQRAEVKDIMDNLQLDAPESAPHNRKKRRRRMSADQSITTPGFLENNHRASDQQSDDLSLQGDADSTIQNGCRRSSLRIYRRQSLKFAVPGKGGEDEGGGAADTISVPKQKHSRKAGADIKSNRVSVQPQLEMPLTSESNGDDPQAESDEKVEDIPAELKDLYQNKNFQKPTDKTWETIFEVPSKGKVTSKQKLKRYLQFEDRVPVAKLQRRQKKAAQNGWNAGAMMKQKRFTELHVRMKLSKLEREIKDS